MASASVLLSPEPSCFSHCPVRRSSRKSQTEQKYIRYSRWESHMQSGTEARARQASGRLYSKQHHCASLRISLTSVNWITTLLRVYHKDQGNLFMKHPVRYKASDPTGKYSFQPEECSNCLFANSLKDKVS